MKRAPINSFRREAYGLVLEESERKLRPLPSEPPQREIDPASPDVRPRDGEKLKALDLALLAVLIGGGVGFWLLAGTLLVRAWTLLVSHVS